MAEDLFHRFLGSLWWGASKLLCDLVQGFFGG